MRRELGAFERAEAWTGASFPYNAVAVLRLEGRPTEMALRSALAEIQRRHPLLRARLVRKGGRWLFDTAPGAVPLHRVERDGDDHWRTVAEDELNHAMETDTAPLARCCLLASPSREAASEIVLSMHHVIIDAVSVATVCRQLLAASTGTGTPPAEPGADRPSPDDGGELPPRPEDRFPPRFRGFRRYPAILGFLARQLADEVGYLWHSRGLRNAAPSGPVRCPILPFSLPKAATTALTRRCRRERVPLNSALIAAQLLAVQHHRHADRAVLLRYLAFPDLRPRLEPPMGPETVASCLTTMRFTIRLGTRESFWLLAQRVDRQLYRSFKRGERFLFHLTSPALVKMMLRLGRVRFGSAGLSYTGPIAFPEYDGLRVRNIHALVSNMPIGPEHAAQARLFRGRLWWDVIYLDADMDEAEARTVAADVLERLEEAAHERD